MLPSQSPKRVRVIYQRLLTAVAVLLAYTLFEQPGFDALRYYMTGQTAPSLGTSTFTLTSHLHFQSITKELVDQLGDFAHFFIVASVVQTCRCVRFP